MPPKKAKPKTKMSKKPIKEDYELSSSSSEGVKEVKLDEEQKKMRSKDISFVCGHCGGRLLLRNEIEINPRGIKLKCNGCSFKLSRNDKTMNVSRDNTGGITVDSEDHSISFSFNRLITPENDEERNRTEMIKDVMGTPRSSSNKQPLPLNDMD